MRHIRRYSFTSLERTKKRNKKPFRPPGTKGRAFRGSTHVPRTRTTSLMRALAGPVTWPTRDNLLQQNAGSMPGERVVFST
jgi:hypothetical protein